MNAEGRVKVWDIAVRLFHWSLVVLFAIAYFTGEDEGMLHIYAGYGIIALILFRLLWGFVGTRYARFSDFVRGPTVTLGYARSLLSGNPRHYLGHNPLGGWMVLALLVALIGSSWTGLEVYGAEGHGPLANNRSVFIASAYAHGDEDHEKKAKKKAEGENKTAAAAEEAGEGDGEDGHDEFWSEIHEGFVNFTLFLIFLHIAGVVISSRLHRENLVRAMVTGYKDADHA